LRSPSRSVQLDEAFKSNLSPKWNHSTKDGELINDASRYGGDTGQSKTAYEDGMARVFQASHRALQPEGRLVIVFAHKHPDAWETLVSAIIRAGIVVDASWPIQTEMGNRTRALASAALSSSVWLICKKRPAAARPGWDNRVLEEMRATIHQRLHDYWKAGIRGPDFVSAATGPALEAYSKHLVVNRAYVGDYVYNRTTSAVFVTYRDGQVIKANGGKKKTRRSDKPAKRPRAARQVK
jgi:adenine-specific DNA methylase